MKASRCGTNFFLVSSFRHTADSCDTSSIDHSSGFFVTCIGFIDRTYNLEAPTAAPVVNLMACQ